MSSKSVKKKEAGMKDNDGKEILKKLRTDIDTGVGDNHLIFNRLETRRIRHTECMIKDWSTCQ